MWALRRLSTAKPLAACATSSAFLFSMKYLYGPFRVLYCCSSFNAQKLADPTLAEALNHPRGSCAASGSSHHLCNTVQSHEKRNAMLPKLPTLLLGDASLVCDVVPHMVDRCVNSDEEKAEIGCGTWKANIRRLMSTDITTSQGKGSFHRPHCVNIKSAPKNSFKSRIDDREATAPCT